MPEEKTMSRPLPEKPEDAQFEASSGLGDKRGSVSASGDDPHTKALTRKLLFKLDTRYAKIKSRRLDILNGLNV